VEQEELLTTFGLTTTDADPSVGRVLHVGAPFLIAIDRAHRPEHFHKYMSYPKANSFRDIRI
jgi:hypothetical protein